jgi:2-polyprenyl-3-methyl-5-hydroxy-6-metoxy-1,4-benzoquinol methylase
MFRIGDARTRRTKRQIAQFMCMDCQSLSNPGGYVEDEVQLERDLQWNIGVEPRNRKAAVRLLDTLRGEGILVGSVLEIGAGTGVLLHELSAQGIKVRGFDVNPKAVAYGTKHFGLDLRCAYWVHDTVAERFDVTLCISVLEHLAEPRGLLADICRYAGRVGGHAFVSVPFVDREKWEFIIDNDPLVPGTPFFDNDVHVTHFSPIGMERCLRDFGAKRVQWLRTGLWDGYLASFG